MRGPRGLARLAQCAGAGGAALRQRPGLGHAGQAQAAHPGSWAGASPTGAGETGAGETGAGETGAAGTVHTRPVGKGPP